MIVITEFVGENNVVAFSAYTIDGIRAETWLDDDGNIREEFTQTGVRFVLDEDTELGQRILAAGLLFEPVIDGQGNLIDIIPREDIESTRQARLAENAQVYQELTETGFKSAVKDGGLKPYRFGLEEVLGLDGLCLQIAFHLQAEPSGESMRLFKWKNAEQLMCDDDWHWTQIRTLFAEFGAFKEAMQWRRDSINAELITAATVEAIAAVVIDYSDLLVFGGGDGGG